jgi:hypothetical protein
MFIHKLPVLFQAVTTAAAGFYVSQIVPAASYGFLDVIMMNFVF